MSELKRCRMCAGPLKRQTMTYCTRACADKAKREQVDVRFWSYVKRKAPTECWEWQGGRTSRGYGKFWVDGKTVPAHRFAYEEINGELDPSLYVCHSCDNPPCCNPTHLWTGTAKENSLDSKQKGRTLSGDRSPMRAHPEIRSYGDKNWTRRYPDRVPRGKDHWMKRHPEKIARGERQGNAKLSEEQVREARSRWVKRKITQKQLANEYGVSLITMNRVLRRVGWKHI